MRIYFEGKTSTFGGPLDRGVKPNEGLALLDGKNWGHYQEYFLPDQPANTSGLARRLNPDKFSVACRWNYEATPAAALVRILVKVTNPRNGRNANAKPVDWGPHRDTGRAIDMSPGLARELGLKTDEAATVRYNS